jgi:hypothetical protein
MDSAKVPVFPARVPLLQQLSTDANVNRFDVSTYILPEEWNWQPTFAWSITKEPTDVWCKIDASCESFRSSIELLCCNEAIEVNADSMQCQGAVLRSEDGKTITVWMTVWYMRNGQWMNEFDNDPVGTVEGEHIAVYTYSE